METLGRGRGIWWVLMSCRVVVVGDPPRVEERGAGQEQSRWTGREGDLRRVQMRCGPTFPKGTPWSCLVFQLRLFFLKSNLIPLCCMLIPSGLRRDWESRNH